MEWQPLFCLPVDQFSQCVCFFSPQHMVEEFWYAVPETCLLFAAFREDFSPIFVGTLTLLFFFKAFHWLADVRIDFVST